MLFFGSSTEWMLGSTPPAGATVPSSFNRTDFERKKIEQPRSVSGDGVSGAGGCWRGADAPLAGMHATRACVVAAVVLLPLVSTREADQNNQNSSEVQLTVTSCM